MVMQENRSTPLSDYRRPDWMYVSQLHRDLQQELQGWHTKISEIEKLKYYEGEVRLNKNEVLTGQIVRSGLTAELLEQVKAALLANTMKVKFTGHRKGDNAVRNQSKREHYWQDKVNKLHGDGDIPNLIAELVDSQLLGCGILKAALDMTLWPAKERRKKPSESVDDHVERVDAYKRQWGHPTSELVAHPLTIYFRPGKGSRVEEIVEHSYKAKSSVYASYKLNLVGQAIVHTSDLAAMPGQPDQFIRPLPMGLDTTQYVLVTEYWNPHCYQVYVNQQLVYEELDKPSVKYFLAPGRASSSKDPDKWGVSVAEALRHNEPIIDRQFTRMVEAGELLVNKRLTIEVPETYNSELDDEPGQDPQPKSFTFKDGEADTLPPGAKLVDAYQGVENIYSGLPLLDRLMSLASSHGVSPLFKGISPGAAGSGYRDNSLYMMAKSLFNYIILSIQACIKAYIEWQEWLLVNHIKDECWSGEWSLKPSDIEGWPATIEVELKPQLPQNLIAEGEFWSRQEERGNVSKRYVREHGLDLEQPEEMEDEVDMEQLKAMLKPLLGQQVLSEIMAPPASPLVDKNGEPMQPSSSNQSGTAAKNPLLAASSAGANGAGREIGREMGGYASGGQPQAPSTQPGTLPGA